MGKKINVLIVDDSAVVRATLRDILASDPDIEVMATACDPIIAMDKIRKQVPDVITLDVEMPRMDGITFLQKLMAEKPVPVVMCSSFTEQGAESTIKAMEAGAVEIIYKPQIGAKQFLEESRIHICDAVKAAALTKLRPSFGKIHKIEPKLTADAVLDKPTNFTPVQTTDTVIIVGASTGGTEALRVFLEAMPQDIPGIVIVQHMPEKFTYAFANRLNSLCRIYVKEAENNDPVSRGCALIAAGNKHLLLKRNGSKYYVEVKDGPLVSRHRPSVDVLFRSAARYAGKNAIGIIMTGMGDDGAKGMREMKDAGAYNIAQDKDSCVVFGMPKEAIKLGGADKILPLEKIAGEVINICAKNNKTRIA